MSKEDLDDLCEGCALNGKQPWSKNPLLVCVWHGGLYPVAHFVVGEEDDATLRHCPAYRPASTMQEKEILR